METNQLAALQPAHPSSIIVVTVTRVEAQAVLEVFRGENTQQWKSKAISNKTYFDLGIHDNMPVFMVRSEMGSATPGGALLTVSKAIQELNAKAVIMCGIAFGLRPDKQKEGDILIAKQLLYYEHQKVDRQKGKIPRGDRVTASDNLLDRFRSSDLDWQGASTHFGLVLSGEKLVNDSVFRDRLLKNEPEAIGGEMEGAGLYVAARDAKVDWILVKAICDWADGNKNSDFQSLAAHNAAQFVFHTIQRGGILGEEKGALQDKLVDIEQKMGQFTEKINTLQKKASEFEQNMERLTREKEASQQAASDLEQKIFQLTEEKDRLQKKASEFEQNMERLSEEKNSFQKEALEFEEKIGQLIKEINTLQKKASEFEEKNEQLKRENANLKDAASDAPNYHGLGFRQLRHELIKYTTDITADNIADKNVQEFIKSLPARKPSLLHFYWIFSRWIDYGISNNDASKHPEIYSCLKKLIDFGLVRQEKREQQTFFVHTENGKGFLLQLRITGDPDAKNEIILG